MKNSLMGLTIFLFMTSCHAYVDINSPQEYTSFQEQKHVFVLSVQTHFNEKVYFSEKFPGKMIGNEITGIYQVPVFQFDPDTLVYRDKRNLTLAYALKNGVRYEVLRQDSLNLLYNPYDLVHLPFSDIQQMSLKTVKPGNTALIVTSVSAGVAGVFLWIISSMTYNLVAL